MIGIEIIASITAGVFANLFGHILTQYLKSRMKKSKEFEVTLEDGSKTYLHIENNEKNEEFELKLSKLLAEKKLQKQLSKN